MNEIEGVVQEDAFAVMTPLEQIVGYTVAEEVYDTLNIREQLVLDLLIAGWNQTEIAEQILLISQPSLSSAVRRIRFKLANTKLKMIMESRRDAHS